MAILDFQRPNKVEMLKGDEYQGLFEFRPLEPGYGTTIGNSIRRILLSSLEGFAITAIRIEGVLHEFTTIPGVIEDVTAIILNLKKIAFFVPRDEEGKFLYDDGFDISVSIQPKGEFTAGAIEGFLPDGCRILNPDLLICTLDRTHNLSLSLRVRKGRGYVNADDNAYENRPSDFILVDSIHSPIKNVKYEVQPYRVGQKTDYENLLIEISTNGSISPQEALTESAMILLQHFSLITNDRIFTPEVHLPIVEEFTQEEQALRAKLRMPLSEWELSVRALNCLRSANVNTMADLISHKKSDIARFRNFGKKSLQEIESLLEENNLEFGMDLSRFKLDID